MPPTGHQALRGRGVRLLQEAGNRKGAVISLQLVAALDVAVAGLRRGRMHAEGDDPPGPRRGGGGLQRLQQGRGVGDHVVSRQHPQHRVRLLLRHQQGGGGDGGGGVAANRLQHHACIAHPGGAQLFADQEAMLVVADNDRRGEARAGGPQRRLLDQAAIRYQRPELLWKGLARHRP
jgi:hypothetical protein